MDAGLLAPHLAHDVHIDPASLPEQPVTYADSMAVTGQTRGPSSTGYSRARNDAFSKPIELSKKPGIWADSDYDHVYPSLSSSGAARSNHY